MTESEAIALLVSTTSNGYKKIDDLPIFKIFLPSFLKSIEKDDKDKDKYKYIIYVGYDNGDILYDIRKHEIKMKIKTMIEGYPNVKLKYVNYENNIKSPCLIWNNLYKLAYTKGCNYFYQLGDDILFITSGWTEVFIEALKKSPVGEDIGVVGPLDINLKRKVAIILTQAFVSRRHYEIFGYLYPEVFKNWFSDDWITEVYQKYYSNLCKAITVKNSGGKERYAIDNGAGNILKEAVRLGEEKIDKYLFNLNHS